MKKGLVFLSIIISVFLFFVCCKDKSIRNKTNYMTDDFIQYQTCTPYSTFDNIDKFRNDEMNKNEKLIVKGKEIHDCYLKFNCDYHYVELPFITIASELGAEITWQSKTMIQISYIDKVFILDTENGSLTLKNESFNILVVAPGSKHGTFYKTINEEFVIDSDSALIFITSVMGANISINFDEKVVTIT